MFLYSLKSITQTNKTCRFFSTTESITDLTLISNKQSKNKGYVIEITDDVVDCSGFPIIQMGSMVVLEKKNTFFKGMVVEIRRDKVSCLFFKNIRTLLPGQKV